MVILITGASHTGKTLLAQRLLEAYRYPYLSIDHLKMGLIRSGYTSLTVEEDDALTEYLWPVVREIIKTVIENGQNLVVEGCYIPFDYRKDFTEESLRNIRFYCLVMSEAYIRARFDDIKKYADAIERRLDDSGCTMARVLKDNAHFLALARAHGAACILIDGRYGIDLDLFAR